MHLQQFLSPQSFSKHKEKHEVSKKKETTQIHFPWRAYATSENFQSFTKGINQHEISI